MQIQLVVTRAKVQDSTYTLYSFTTRSDSQSRDYAWTLVVRVYNKVYI